jgi:hypothetical protein
MSGLLLFNSLQYFLGGVIFERCDHTLMSEGYAMDLSLVSLVLCYGIPGLIIYVDRQTNDARIFNE